MSKDSLLGSIFLLLSNEMLKGTFCQDEPCSDFLGSTSDFARLVKSKTFADKTLLLKEILGESENYEQSFLANRYVITAPPGSGKTMALDMVRRFLAIPINDKGEKLGIDENINYKLFKENNLNISRDSEFFNKHFGQHLVLYVDFKLIGQVENFREFLVGFKKVLSETFTRYSYLKRKMQDLNMTVKFDAYMSPVSVLSEDDLKSGLWFLLKQFQWFGWNLYKKVFLLVDNYDSVMESIMFTGQGSHEINRVYSFLHSLIDDLFTNRYSQYYFSGVLVMSVVNVLAGGVLSRRKEHHMLKSMHYSYLGNHCFSTYFGFTDDDLQLILSKVINDNEKRSNMIKVISNLHVRKIEDTDISIYNMKSVLQFLKTEQSPTKAPLDSGLFDKLNILFRLPAVLNNVLMLLDNKGVEISLNKDFNKHDLQLLNKLYLCLSSNTFDEDVYNNLPVTAFMNLLYHLGFLTLSARMYHHIYVEIANKGAKLKLAQSLKKTFIDLEFDKFNKLQMLSPQEIYSLYQSNRKDTTIVFCKILSELNAL